jgi:hypothetical protein
MTSLWSNSFGSRTGLAGLTAMAFLLASPAVCAQPPVGGAVPAGAPAMPGESLLVQAAKAEGDLRFESAIDRLYELLIEHPGTADALTARLRMARLLAVTGSLPQAILECQLLRDELPMDHPLRAEALALATVLARRLRASPSSGAPYFAIFEPVPARGVQALDEPRALVFEGESRFVLLDEGAGRVYRVGAESASPVASPQDPTAAAVMPDGTLVMAGKTGLMTVPASRTIQLSGTWGGKARQAKKVRSMAALSDGSLLVVDRDYDGVLRCQLSSGACAPWGPIGKYRVVKVGPTDWVYLLDDRGQGVRVIDASQRAITLVGPVAGVTKLEKIGDIAVDAAHGLCLLDTDLKRILIVHLKTGADGRIGPMLTATVALPQEGERAVKNPTAIGVSPSGSVYVAGKSSPRMMRYR